MEVENIPRHNMDYELEEILRDTLCLDDDFVISDELFVGDIIEWDSLSHMNLIYVISNTYQIEIPFKDLNNIHSWGELKKYVCKRKKQ